jgi:FkbM family methyltransferase
MNTDLISKYIKPKFVIDVGANDGFVAKAMKAAWPDANFMLIEANEECEPALRETGFPYRIAALSDQEKEVDFFTSVETPMASGASYYREKTPYFEGDKAATVVLKTRTLDELIKSVLLMFPLLIKLDTQGSELDILKGGEKTLAKADAVVVELSKVEYNIGAPFCDEVDQFLQDHGFKTVDVVGEFIMARELIQSDVLYMKK